MYVAFSIHFQVQDFPATAVGLRLFAEFLLRTCKAAKSVTNALASIKTFHRQLRLPLTAFSDFRVESYIRALPPTVRHVAQPAPPIQRHTLDQLCTLALTQGAHGAVFAALLSTAFFSLARLSSLVPPSQLGFDGTRLPTLGDVRVEGDSVLLRLKWGKNFQAASQGFWVPLPSLTGSVACPVARLGALLRLHGACTSSTPLFAFPACPTGSLARPRGFTLQLARTWLSSCLAVLGLGASGFTFHSFRRGASTLAFERGAALSDIQALGGWRSSAVLEYVPALAARQRAAAVLARGPDSSLPPRS